MGILNITLSKCNSLFIFSYIADTRNAGSRTKFKIKRTCRIKFYEVKRTTHKFCLELPCLTRQ